MKMFRMGNASCFREKMVKTGDIVLKAGTRIGPAQAGTLAALGVVQVPVLNRGRWAVLSTGDELVRIDQVLDRGRCGILIHGRCPVM